MLRFLEGVRVVEFGLLLNGDQLGMHFVDLGAEVIKVEDAKVGDYLRDIMGQIEPRVSPAHLQTNKGKKSLAIDLTSEDARRIVLDLIASADVVIDGLRPGVCDKMGVGFEACRRAKPDVIYVQYTGFGATGPYANIPTHGYHMSAAAGGWPVRIDADGRPRKAHGVQFMGGAEESSSPSALGAHFAAMAALAALHRRAQTGEAQHIDVGASDAVIATAWMGMVYNLNYDRITDFRTLGQKAESYEAKWPNGSVRYQLYETKDHRFVLAGLIEKKFWKLFCEAAGRPDLVETFRGDQSTDYGEDKPWLRDEVAAIIAARTLAEWTSLAAELGLAIGPANSLEDVPLDPHIRSRGIFVEGQGGGGPFTFVGFPAVVGGQPYELPATAPAHGEHTDEVLADLGVPAVEVERLRREGLIK